MENVAHDGLVRHLGVVGVRVVDRVVLALTHVGGKGFAVVPFDFAQGARRIIFFLGFPLSDKVGNPPAILGECLKSVI